MNLAALNLEKAFDQVTDYWSPAIIGEVNDSYVKIAKLKGEFVWHAHDLEDELFYIVKGELLIHTREGDIHLKKGDLYIIPRGLQHNPFAQNECWVMLLEPKSTAHTGNVVTKGTKSVEEQLSNGKKLS